MIRKPVNNLVGVYKPSYIDNKTGTQPYQYIKYYLKTVIGLSGNIRVKYIHYKIYHIIWIGGLSW